MKPLLYDNAVAAGIFYATFVIWLILEFRVHPTDRDGAGISCDRGIRVIFIFATFFGMAGALIGMLRRIAVEETALADGLGTAYQDYAHGRARLIPGLW
ncbi:MAG: hypothetical protein M3460_14290 [Actinomycetota bacterium]|jgi:protein-S-isoprenylcysteine O-methyltransferase Ste14|nr:hypothetical protein [Actinomycetota bacterium]